MELRCVPGDLAVILRGEGAGVFVDVLRRAKDQPISGLPSWEVRLKAPVRCSIVAYGHPHKPPRIVKYTEVPAGEVACIPDNNLQPIRPPAPPKAIPAPPREVETT